MLLYFSFVSFLLFLSKLSNAVSTWPFSCFMSFLMHSISSVWDMINPSSCLLAYLTTYLFIVQYRVGIVALSLSQGSYAYSFRKLMMSCDAIYVFVDPDESERLKVCFCFFISFLILLLFFWFQMYEIYSLLIEKLSMTLWI